MPWFIFCPLSQSWWASTVCKVKVLGHVWFKWHLILVPLGLFWHYAIQWGSDSVCMRVCNLLVHMQPSTYQWWDSWTLSITTSVFYPSSLLPLCLGIRTYRYLETSNSVWLSGFHQACYDDPALLSLCFSTCFPFLLNSYCLRTTFGAQEDESTQAYKC